MNKILLSMLLLVLVASCSPVSTPVPVSTDAASSAIAAMDGFYTVVNSAQDKKELAKLWNMISLEEQCNAIYKCTLDGFEDRVWQSKGAYRLFDCGNNVVIAEEMHSSDDPSATPAAPKFWRYKLMETDEGLLISDVSASQAPGDECVMAVDHAVTP